MFAYISFFINYKADSYEILMGFKYNNLLVTCQKQLCQFQYSPHYVLCTSCIANLGISWSAAYECQFQVPSYVSDDRRSSEYNNSNFLEALRP